MSKKILSGLTILAFLTLSQPLWALSSNQLEKGQVDVQLIDTKDIKGVKAVSVIKAPPAKVWGTLVDYKNYPKFMPRVVESTIKKQEGNVYYVYNKMDTPWPFADMWYTNRCTTDAKNYTFNWTMVEGSISSTKGFWKLQPYKNNWTMATYSVEVDFGIPLIPQWVIDHISSTTVPGIFKGLRDYLKV